MLDKHPIYQELSMDEVEMRKKYRQFLEEMLRTKDAMRGEMDRRAIYGSGMFVGHLRKDYEIEEMVRPVGRPKRKGQK